MFQFQSEDICLPDVARDILANWGMEDLAPNFLATPDGVAVLAHMCNAAAKVVDASFYQYKSALVKLCIKYHPEVWGRDGVVYVETARTQVSFHVFEGEDTLAGDMEGKEWNGLHLQPYAKEVAMDYLEHLQVAG